MILAEKCKHVVVFILLSKKVQLNYIKAENKMI